jgi:hypothetical protein
MKLVSNACRLLTGGFFIFSGLVKLNDPYGTAYKLEEYFGVFAADISPFFLSFIPYSLFLSIFLCAFEVILGAAILLYYRMRITAWISLFLILFFTFLKFYSFYFDKVKECGCFGTAIKLSPGLSFLIDLFFLALILILFFNRKNLESGFNNLKGDIIMLLITIFSFGTGIYSKNHLPFFDTTNYKQDNDLKSLTKPKGRARYEWILEKEGKEFSFTDENYPADTAYKYKRHILLTDSSLLTPEISGFKIYNEEGDFTEEAFKGSKILIIIANPAKALENCSGPCMDRINNLIRDLSNSEIKPMILTIPPVGSSFDDYRNEVQLSGDYYYMDDTILKTMIRSNPGLILLKDGMIKGKWHYNDVPETEKIKLLIK